MPAVVIIGLKISFRHLWKKTGVVDKPSCNCPITGQTFSYCPHCGTRKRKQSVKLYVSRLTGKETTFRTIESLNEYLQQHNLAIYDNNPRGYTDDNVYLYFTDPMCYIESSAPGESTSPKLNKSLSKLDDWLYDFLGDELWNLGEFGVWLIEKPLTETTPAAPTVAAKPAAPEQTQTRTFIIPLGPHLE